MRNTEKMRRSATPNLLVQFPLAELTLQLAVDPSKSRRSIPARADGKSRRSIPAKADGRSQQEPTVDPEMKDRFQMSDLVLLSYYLGIEVKQGVDGIFLCQAAYAGKLLDRCGLISCNP
jgi:hypothetical protein